MASSFASAVAANSLTPVKMAALLTPGEMPDASKTGHLRKWLDYLLFADLRSSYGQ